MLSTVITVIGCIVGVLGFAVAFVTLWRSKEADTKEETKENVAVHTGLQSQIDVLNGILETRLDAIDNGVRDLKADNRGFRSELIKMRDEIREELRLMRAEMDDRISEVHDEARHALELAEAAHRRLDRIGAAKDDFNKGGK